TGSISSNFTKSIISTALSACSFFNASKSSSSSITNLFFAYSYAFTISSFSIFRSQLGHTFSYLTGVWHSLCSCRSETSLFSVAACILTGMLTSPKLIVPFHIVCMKKPPFPDSLSIQDFFIRGISLINLFDLSLLSDYPQAIVINGDNVNKPFIDKVQNVDTFCG